MLTNIAAIAAGLSLLFLAVVILLYNRLVAHRNECDKAWSQVDVQLKRRADLLPKLVETVRGVMAFEKDTLEAVTRARSSAMSAATPAERMGAELQVGALLSGILGRWENYPVLQSNQNAMELQEEIVSTENRLAFSRTYYNDVTTGYNTLIQTFPAVLFARGLGFEKRPWFKDSAAA